MTDPLDHDGDGRKGGSAPRKRGRPAKVKTNEGEIQAQDGSEVEAGSAASEGARRTDAQGGGEGQPTLRVKKPDTIHDGEGGFLPVGAKFAPVDEDAAEHLKARGLAE